MTWPDCTPMGTIMHYFNISEVTDTPRGPKGSIGADYDFSNEWFHWTTSHLNNFPVWRVLFCCKFISTFYLIQTSLLYSTRKNHIFLSKNNRIYCKRMSTITYLSDNMCNVSNKSKWYEKLSSQMKINQ